MKRPAEKLEMTPDEVHDLAIWYARRTVQWAWLAGLLAVTAVWFGALADWWTPGCTVAAVVTAALPAWASVACSEQYKELHTAAHAPAKPTFVESAEQAWAAAAANEASFAHRVASGLAGEPHVIFEAEPGEAIFPGDPDTRIDDAPPEGIARPGRSHPRTRRADRLAGLADEAASADRREGQA